MVDIIDGWSFKVDEYQYTLVHTYTREKLDFKTRKPTGEMVEVSEDVGYFATVVGMLRKLAEILVREKISEGQIKTIREYIAELKKINKMLYDACKM